MTRAALVLLPALVLLAAACGDDDESAAPSPTGGGPLPQYLASVTPPHGASVTNDELPIGDPHAADGICAGFSFRSGDGMGDQPAERVTMLFDGGDVTFRLTWQVTADHPTSMGTGCYAPPEALPPGRHEVTVRYSDSNNREYEYTWQFVVTG